MNIKKDLENCIIECMELDYNNMIENEEINEIETPFRNFAGIRTSEIFKYFEIKGKNKYLTINTYKSYSGKHVLKNFLKINEEYNLNFKVNYNREEMSLKIDIKDLFEEEERPFIVEMANMLYMESYR